jgi:3,4-dihydroxy 2-butanone 4-phosphate synthase/GTP cyclohydrolase II
VLPPKRLTWTAYVSETPGAPPHNQMLALALGEIDDQPTLVRVQVGNVLGDVFGARFGTRVVAAEALWRIEAEGKGVILYIPPRMDMLSDLRSLLGQQLPRIDNDTVLREIGFGAQVLRDLGVRKMRVLTNTPRRIVAVDAYELEVVEEVALREPTGTTIKPPSA